MKQRFRLIGSLFFIVMFFLISVLGCVATGTQSVIKQNVKLILEDKNYDKALTNLET